MTIWRKSQTSAFCFSRINSALLWDWPVSSPSGPRPLTVLFQLGGGPHSCPEWRPTAKYGLVNLTSGLKCLRESVCFVLSHVPVQQKKNKKNTHIVIRAEERRAGLAGPPAAGKGFGVCGCWWPQPHCLHWWRNRRYLTSRSRLSPRRSSDAFVLSSDVPHLNFSRAVGSPLVMDPNTICRKAKRLAGKQAELCQTQPEIVREVAKGARLGVRECQYQFRYRRWNCTSHNKYFGKILQQGE